PHEQRCPEILRVAVLVGHEAPVLLIHGEGALKIEVLRVLRVAGRIRFRSEEAAEPGTCVLEPQANCGVGIGGEQIVPGPGCRIAPRDDAAYSAPTAGTRTNRASGAGPQSNRDRD